MIQSLLNRVVLSHMDTYLACAFLILSLLLILGSFCANEKQTLYQIQTNYYYLRNISRIACKTSQGKILLLLLNFPVFSYDYTQDVRLVTQQVVQNFTTWPSLWCQCHIVQILTTGPCLPCLWHQCCIRVTQQPSNCSVLLNGP